MFKPIEFKLYPNMAQAETLNRWLRTSCWIYNKALDHRIKAYKRRKQSVMYIDQQAMLTEWRSRIDSIQSVPVDFSRDALRRVDRGFKAFFRRIKKGEKPGFPRFRSHTRFNSIECLVPRKYADGQKIVIPKLGKINARGPEIPEGEQRLLRIIRRAKGWFAQVLIKYHVSQVVPIAPEGSSVGIDVGLTAFATLSTGEKIDNPRFARRSERILRSAQRRVSRRVKGSKNRRKAVRKLQQVHERIAAQRRAFAHQESRKIVNRFQNIGFEKLNIQGMVRNHGLARSIMDAAWGMFTAYLTYKAEKAGGRAVGVHAPGTSQECPWCGNVKPKLLSERTHECECRPSVKLDRDHASGLVIRERMLVATGMKSPVEESASVLSYNCDEVSRSCETGKFHLDNK